MLPNVTRILLVIAGLLTVPCQAFALMPLAKPEPFAKIDPGLSEPFVGAWSISIPTMEVGTADTALATCEKPVHIEAADETHIFYLGPRDTEADAAVALERLNGGTVWEPVAGGPSYFAFWVSQDLFYLYDEVPQVDADWGMPYMYRRCQ